MASDPKTQAQLRKEVYEFLGNKGHKLTDAEQKELSTILKSVYETRERVVTVEKWAPKKHTIICPSCLKEKTGDKSMVRNAVQKKGRIIKKSKAQSDGGSQA